MTASGDNDSGGMISDHFIIGGPSMDSKAVTISELVSGMLSEARRLGVSESTLWRSWEPKANSVAVYYRERGLCIYSPEITEEYLRLIKRNLMLAPKLIFLSAKQSNHTCYPV